MVMQMSQIPKKISQTILVLTVVGLGFIVLSCASNNYKATQLADADIETLKNLWLKSSSHNTRKEIVSELEKRKAVDALIYCHHFATFYYKSSGGGGRGAWGKFPIEDGIVIVSALGRLKDPKAINSIAETGRFTAHNKSKQLKLAILKAYKEIDSPGAVPLIKNYLRDPDYDIRFQALDTLSHLESSESMEMVFAALFDDDANIRWKAVHALGEIGNPKAAGRISLLLADPDESVRGLAENVLKKLGTSEEKIADWKQKAGQLSIDEVYRTKLAYQKAEIEKEELVKKRKRS
jgi:hypothetical protein